ncbi:MAG: xanthine dehydrogenase small subunit [Gammaproteobacteria bacterium]
MAAEGKGRTSVRFYLNGQLHEVKGISPTSTVLNYLRDDLLQTGTKEGCAEGDCGACTVLIAEPRQGRIRFRPINSCIQFVPTLDGKALFTVEGLRKFGSGDLHPVQRAMVDCHASQCGFCTPGFVMSLFALYKSQSKPDRNAIDDALAGNLCRCTGYRPIISAAKKMYEYGEQLDNQEQNFFSMPYSVAEQESISVDEQTLLDQLGVIRPQSDFSIDKKYFAPTSVSSLAELFNHYPEATLLAGGTDVGLWVTKQLRDLPLIIYLGQIESLNTIDVDKEFMTIGASVNLSDAFEEVLRHYPDLSEIFRRFASPPIRNAGTLCGNVANGSPIGDSMPALITMGTSILLRNGAKTRELPLDKFYLGYQHKDLNKGEFVEAIRIPLPAKGQYLRSYKISKRFDQDISAVCAAYSLRLEEGKVDELRICYGGMAATPQRAEQCELALVGKTWELATLEEGISALEKDFTPLSDMRASADYRSRVAANLLRRFYHEVNGADESTTQVLHYAG